MKNRVRGYGVSQLVLAFLFSTFTVALVAQTTTQAASVNVTGKWQISWEARIGTERDTIQLEQADSKLTGKFQGRSADPKVSGSVDGKNISLRLDFPGKQPYSLVFTGVIDGDKMSGKFEVPGVPGAYDFHGENIRPSNYTWSAVRLPEVRQQSRASR